jgi:hypothetical protein
MCFGWDIRLANQDNITLGLRLDIICYYQVSKCKSFKYQAAENPNKSSSWELTDCKRIARGGRKMQGIPNQPGDGWHCYMEAPLR